MLLCNQRGLESAKRNLALKLAKGCAIARAKTIEQRHFAAKQSIIKTAEQVAIALGL